jgi:hypothetical protein
MRRPYIAAMALLAAAVVGCGSSPAPRPAKPAPAAIPAQALRVACPSGSSAAARRSAALPSKAIPAGFIPVAVVLCGPAVVFVNHNHANVPPTRHVATANLGRLMAALRAPSAPANSNVICAAHVISIAWFVLIGKNGQVILPKLPTTACGDPSPAVRASLGALQWRNLP